MARMRGLFEMLSPKRKRGSAKDETAIVKAIKATLELAGFTVVRMNVSGIVRSLPGGKTIMTPNPNKGFPDLMGWFRDGTGRAWVCEVKTHESHSRLESEQKEWLKLLNSLGVFCMVSRSPEYALNLLSQAEAEHDKRFVHSQKPERNPTCES